MKPFCLALTITFLTYGCAKENPNLLDDQNPLVYLGKYSYQTQTLDAFSSEPIAFDSQTNEPFQVVSIEFSSQTAKLSRSFATMTSPMPVCDAVLKLSEQEIQSIHLALQNIDLCQKKQELVEVACTMFLPAQYMSVRTNVGNIDLTPYCDNGGKPRACHWNEEKPIRALLQSIFQNKEISCD